MKHASLLLALICVTAGPGYAKPTSSQKKAPSSAVKTEPAAAPVVSLDTASAPSTAADVIARFQSIDGQISSLKAHYIQTVNMEETGTTQTIEGSIAYLKPDRLRIEHSRPERQTFVSDGKAIWVHRLSSNQVIQSELADWRKADPLTNSLLDFGGYASLAKRYDVAYSSPTREVVLTPKEKGAGYTLRMTLAEKTYFPAETELLLAHMHVRTTLQNLVFNTKLPESDFNFTPPPGADVFRNFKPPRLSQ